MCNTTMSVLDLGNCQVKVGFLREQLILMLRLINNAGAPVNVVELSQGIFKLQLSLEAVKGPVDRERAKIIPSHSDSCEDDS